MKPVCVIVHCSATKDSGTVSWSAIRRYHTETLGWRDIGYHVGIEKVTDAAGRSTYETFLGRPLTMQGAHCAAQGMNSRSLGVCFVGDYDNEPPPFEMIKTGARHLAALCRVFNIPVDSIYGHRDFDKGKTCPGLKFDMKELRQLTHREL